METALQVRLAVVVGEASADVRVHPLVFAPGRLAVTPAVARENLNVPSSTGNTLTGDVNIVSINGALAPIPEGEVDGIRQLVETALPYDSCPYGSVHW